MISQELFDETVLENEEIFELSPEEALQETIDQLTKQQQQQQQQQQTLDSPKDSSSLSSSSSSFLNHLCLSHPDSPQGQQERRARQQFVQWCDVLDTCIQSDGSVSTTATMSATTTTLPLVEALQGIQDHCNSRNPDKQSYLFLFQQQESIYTLMSLLGVMSSSTHKKKSDDHDVDDGDFEDDTTCRETILQETLKTLILLLGSIPTLRDSFVAWERWMELFQWSVKAPKLKIATELLRLAHVACLQCEPNKVNWMRTCRRTPGGIGFVLTCLKYSPKELVLGQEHNDTTTNNNASTNTNPTAQIMTMMIQACKLIVVVCRFDDYREPSSVSSSATGQPSLSGAGLPTVSSAHDNVMELSREGTVPVLINLLKNSSKEQEELRSILLQALRVLAIQDDIIQSMVALGLLQVVQEILCTSLDQKEKDDLTTTTTTTSTTDTTTAKEEEKEDTTTTTTIPKQSSSCSNLVASALGLMRNLSGNDDIKTTLCQGGGRGGSATSSSSSSKKASTAAALPQILQAMKLFLNHTKIQQHGCGTLAAMALRRPTNVMEILSQNGHVQILRAMKSHPTNVAIQRQGSLALRNIVSRPLDTTTTTTSSNNNHGKHPPTDDSSPPLNAKEILLESGAEQVLKEIAGAHQGSMDEAYAALRDLGIQGVKLWKVGSDGRLESRVSSYNVEAVMAAAAVTGDGMATTANKVSNFRPVFETSRVLDDL